MLKPMEAILRPYKDFYVRQGLGPGVGRHSHVLCLWCDSCIYSRSACVRCSHLLEDALILLAGRMLLTVQGAVLRLFSALMWYYSSSSLCEAKKMHNNFIVPQILDPENRRSAVPSFRHLRVINIIALIGTSYSALFILVRPFSFKLSFLRQSSDSCRCCPSLPYRPCTAWRPRWGKTL